MSVGLLQIHQPAYAGQVLDTPFQSTVTTPENKPFFLGADEIVLAPFNPGVIGSFLDWMETMFSPMSQVFPVDKMPTEEGESFSLVEAASVSSTPQNVLSNPSEKDSQQWSSLLNDADPHHEIMTHALQDITTHSPDGQAMLGQLTEMSKSPEEGGMGLQIRSGDTNGIANGAEVEGYYSPPGYQTDAQGNIVLDEQGNPLLSSTPELVISDQIVQAAEADLADGEPGEDYYKFQRVLMHEMGHAIGPDNNNSISEELLVNSKAELEVFKMRLMHQGVSPEEAEDRAGKEFHPSWDYDTVANLYGPENLPSENDASMPYRRLGIGVEDIPRLDPMSWA